jgi:hypothetical protein
MKLNLIILIFKIYLSYCNNTASTISYKNLEGFNLILNEIFINSMLSLYQNKIIKSIESIKLGKLKFEAKDLHDRLGFVFSHLKINIPQPSDIIFPTHKVTLIEKFEDQNQLISIDFSGTSCVFKNIKIKIFWSKDSITPALYTIDAYPIFEQLVLHLTPITTVINNKKIVIFELAKLDTKLDLKIAGSTYLALVASKMVATEKAKDILNGFLKDPGMLSKLLSYLNLNIKKQDYIYSFEEFVNIDFSLRREPAIKNKNLYLSLDTNVYDKSKYLDYLGITTLKHDTIESIDPNSHFNISLGEKLINQVFKTYIDKRGIAFEYRPPLSKEKNFLNIIVEKLTCEKCFSHFGLLETPILSIDKNIINLKNLKVELAAYEFKEKNGQPTPENYEPVLLMTFEIEQISLRASVTGLTYTVQVENTAIKCSNAHVIYADNVLITTAVSGLCFLLDPVLSFYREKINRQYQNETIPPLIKELGDHEGLSLSLSNDLVNLGLQLTEANIERLKNVSDIIDNITTVKEDKEEKKVKEEVQNFPINKGEGCKANVEFSIKDNINYQFVPKIKIKNSTIFLNYLLYNKLHFDFGDEKDLTFRDRFYLHKIAEEPISKYSIDIKSFTQRLIIEQNSVVGVFRTKDNMQCQIRIDFIDKKSEIWQRKLKYFFATRWTNFKAYIPEVDMIMRNLEKLKP